MPVWLWLLFLAKLVGGASVGSSQRAPAQRQTSVRNDMLQLLDMAQISNLCDVAPFKIRRGLSLSSTKRDKIHVLQRRLDAFGLLYNIIDYTCQRTRQRRRVLSIRGTKNWRNMGSNFDSTLVRSDLIGGTMLAHRGYSLAAEAIYEDLIVGKCDGAPLLTSTAPEAQQPDTVHLTGHSMGGCVGILLGLALQHNKQSLGAPMAGVVTFGSPRFLDAVGIEACASLPSLSCVEHCLDPITMDLPNITLPSMPSMPSIPSLPSLPVNVTSLLQSMPQMPQVPSLPQLPKLPKLPSAIDASLHLLVPRRDLLGGLVTLNDVACMVGAEAVSEKAKLARSLPPRSPDLTFHKMDSYVSLLAQLAEVDAKYTLLNLSSEFQ